MKLAVKRMYCVYCRRLVRGVERLDEDTVRILCGRCHRPLYMWDGVNWRAEKVIKATA